MPNDREYDIYDRAFKFAVRTAKCIEKLTKNLIRIEYSRQLIKSGEPIRSNIFEADGALSKKDFINKMGISRREAKESKHWLRLIEAVASLKEESMENELSWLIRERTEIL